MAFLPIKTDSQGDGVVVFGGSQTDAFGRGRVSSPTSVFTISFEYDGHTRQMQTVNVGAGTTTKTANVSSMTLSTGGTTSTHGTIFQTKAYHRYEPGKSQLIQMTGVLGAYTQYVRAQVGYYDGSNGVFFDMDGTSQGATGKPAVTVRTSTSGSVADTAVLQSSWNLDIMDGTGLSKVTLDFSKAQIFIIDLQWLGEGRIRFGFNVGGTIVYCHQINNANLIALPWANTACLPARFEIHNVGSPSGTTTMKAGCISVISEGGQEAPQAIEFSADNGHTGITTSNGSAVPAVSIQPKLTFNSITNRSRILVGSVEVFVVGSNAVYWKLVYNGTLSGGTPTWTSVNARSFANYNVDSTGCAGGDVIISGYAGGGAGSSKVGIQENISARLPLTLDAGGTVQDVYTIRVTGIGGTPVAYAAIAWSEER